MHGLLCAVLWLSCAQLLYHLLVDESSCRAMRGLVIVAVGFLHLELVASAGSVSFSPGDLLVCVQKFQKATGSYSQNFCLSSLTIALNLVSQENSTCSRCSRWLGSPADRGMRVGRLHNCFADDAGFLKVCPFKHSDGVARISYEARAELPKSCFYQTSRSFIVAGTTEPVSITLAEAGMSWHHCAMKLWRSAAGEANEADDMNQFINNDEAIDAGTAGQQASDSEDENAGPEREEMESFDIEDQGAEDHE